MPSRTFTQPTPAQPKSKDHHYHPTLRTPTVLVLLSQYLPSPFLVLFWANIDCAPTLDGNATLLFTPHLLQHHLKTFLHQKLISTMYSAMYLLGQFTFLVFIIVELAEECALSSSKFFLFIDARLTLARGNRKVC